MGDSAVWTSTPIAVSLRRVWCYAFEVGSIHEGRINHWIAISASGLFYCSHLTGL
jgi:hypothetical protein